MDAKLLLNAKAILGEGAIWNHLINKLYWVDIEGKCFNVFDPYTGENKVYHTNKRIGTVVPVGAETVLIALEDGIATLELESGIITYKNNTDIHTTHHKRFNDGKCDPQGRFWVGTLSMDGVRKVSSLYCIQKDFSLVEKISGVSISNGIVWSLDGSLMYYVDTPTGEIVQYDFDVEQGNITNRKMIVKIPEEMGCPDGMTIDNEGMLWVALWDGFCVARFDPRNGQLLQKVNVPAPKVSSCTFGGKNFDQLYITTASCEMSEEEHEKYPLSGALFIADTMVKGMPSNHFKVDEDQ